MANRVHLLFEDPTDADMAAGELIDWLSRWFIDEDYEVSVKENLVVLRDKREEDDPPQDEEPEEPMGWLP